MWITKNFVDYQMWIEYNKHDLSKNVMELNLSTKIHIWHCFIKLVDDENYTNKDGDNMINVEGNIKQKNLKNITVSLTYYHVK